MFRCLLLLVVASSLLAQKNRFSPKVAESPEMKKAFAWVDANAGAIQSEWKALTEIPAPSKQEKLRTEYMKTAMARVGLKNVQSDAMGNVWSVYPGTGGGPEVVFIAHIDTVFPMETDIKVREVNGRYLAPGIGDDTGAVVALLHAFDGMRKNNVRTNGDIIFLASVQEEIGLYGAKHWLSNREKKPDMIVAVDTRLGGVAYGALRIEQFRFVYEGPAMHTLASRGKPNPARAAARAIVAIGEMKLPDPDPMQGMNLPVVNVGTLGGGTVVNAVPGRVFFTADIRSFDTPTEQMLVEQVKTIAQRAANQEGVQMRIEPVNEPIDYSRALPKETRLNHPVTQIAVAVTDYLKLNLEPTEPSDTGSDDHNIGVAMGIPSIAVGAVLGRGGHSLEESADPASIIRGTKYMMLLAAALAVTN
jgi:acetylornithine deacetylase/succinyl-diaminopimelate desuccinylase-like protein